MTRPRVYFYCSDEPGNLQEDVVALAEGLRELGVPFHANCDYWQQSTTPGDILLRHDPQIGPDDCDIVVVASTWPLFVRMRTFDVVRRPLPDGLFKPGRRYVTVYVDNHDNHRTISWEPEFRQFDVILRSKANRRAWRPANLKPWVHGLTNRILNATADPLPFDKRHRVLLVNFGASHPFPHETRDFARRLFEPKIEQVLPIDRTRDDLSIEPGADYDKLMWRQTGGRFSRSYYTRLKSSQAVACFCGGLIPPMPYTNPECYLVGGNRAKLRKALYEMLTLFDARPRRAIQWDSFRFWEATAAGCAAVNLDLAHYGVELPAMPRNGVHYLGVDLARVDDFVARLREDAGLLRRVAEAGRTWAIDNYGPRAMAERFLAHAGFAAAP
jgi:hypothetical protein